MTTTCDLCGWRIENTEPLSEAGRHKACEEQRCEGILARLDADGRLPEWERIRELARRWREGDGVG